MEAKQERLDERSEKILRKANEEAADILRADRMLYAASFLALAVLGAARCLVMFCLPG